MTELRRHAIRQFGKHEFQKRDQTSCELTTTRDEAFVLRLQGLVRKIKQAVDLSPLI